METKKLKNAFIKTLYKQVSDEKSPLNPGFIPKDQSRTRFQFFDKMRIFYIIRCPDSVTGYKLGRSRRRETESGVSFGGGARLRQYYNAYGNAKGFYVQQVIEFNNRKKTQAGELGKEGKWAETVFERQVINNLKKNGVKPLRGSEYFEKLEDIQQAVNEVLKSWTFVPTETRRSKRINEKEGYVKPKIGDEIEYAFPEENQLRTYKGNVFRQIKDGNRKSTFLVDFRDDPTYVGGDKFAYLRLDKSTFTNASKLRNEYTFRYVNKRTPQTVNKPTKKDKAKAKKKLAKKTNRTIKITFPQLSKLERALKKLEQENINVKFVKPKRRKRQSLYNPIVTALSKRQRALRKIGKSK